MKIITRLFRALQKASLLCSVSLALAGQGAAQTVIANIPACGQATSPISVNARTNVVHAFGQGDGTIIDGATNTVIACVPAIGTFSSVDVNPNTDRYYVSHQQAGSVTVGSGISPAVVATISVAGFPTDIVVNPATNRIYVTSQGFGGNDRVFVIDGATNTLIGPAGGIPTGGVAGPILGNPLTNRVYVGTSNGLAVIDGFTNSLLTTIPGFTSGGSAVVNIATNRLYARRDSDGMIAVIDGWTNATIDVVSLATPTTSPAPVGVNQAMNRIHIAALDVGHLLIASGTTNAELTSVMVPPNPFGGRAGVHPITNRIYLQSTVPGSASVVVIDDDLTFGP